MSIPVTSPTFLVLNSIISVSRSMRRPSMLPADTGVEQCIEALAASPNSIFQDHQLIAWFRLECLMEATNLLGHVERGTKPEFADDSTQRTVKLLDSRLSEWRASLSPGLLIRKLFTLSNLQIALILSNSHIGNDLSS